MNKDSSSYKVIPTRECIKYIEKHGLTIHDNSAYKIKSSSGLVYILPDSEVVLIPTNFDLNYPGIIFENFKIFNNFAKSDFFPIGEGNMTWFERYNKQIKQFQIHPEFYKLILETHKVDFQFKNDRDIRSAFLKVQSIIYSKQKMTSHIKTQDLIFSFGLAVTNYLLEFKGLKPIFKSGYENYNPITEVLVEKDGKRKNILTISLIYLEKYSPNALAGFMHSIGLHLN